MTDTSAPTAPPPSAPTPAQGEVVINQNPTTTPTPIGPQAPDKPEAGSRREAIQRAFNKSREPDQPKPKAAEAKMGHNNPPEDMKREAKPAPKSYPSGDDEGEGKIDLRRRQSDQPRGDRGQFAPRAPQAGQPDRNAGAPTGEPQVGQQPAVSGQPHKQLPANTPYRDPPQRMAEHAKAEWHAAPESVRGEVHRMHQEFSRAYNAFKGDHDVMNTIREYHEMATAHGTTLDKALGNYVGMEQKLRSDPIGGLDMIISNLNLRTPEGEKITSRDVAYHILSQTPDQQKVLQTANQTTALSHQLGQLHQQNQHLAQQVNQMQYAQTFSYTRSEVDRFAETHPRFDELGELIEYELKFGHDLETAYRRADLLSPNPAAQTRSPAAQTRNPDRSISGAPESALPSGSERRQRKSGEKQPSRRDTIQRAINRVNGAL